METAHYARLYLGQLFYYKTESGYEAVDMINMVCENGNDVYGLYNDLYFWDTGGEKIVEFKMILRHAADMPMNERREYKAMCKRINDSNNQLVWIADTPQSLNYLFDKGYDAFDLIEKGQAIDYEDFIKNKHLQDLHDKNKSLTT